MVAYSWTGAISGDWQTPGNWSPVGVPGSAAYDTVVDTVNNPIVFGAPPPGAVYDLNGDPLNMGKSSAAVLEQGSQVNLAVSQGQYGGPGPASISLQPGSYAHLTVTEGDVNVNSTGGTVAVSTFEGGANFTIQQGDTLAVTNAVAGKAAGLQFNGPGTLNLQGGMGEYAGGGSGISISVSRLTGQGNIASSGNTTVSAIVDPDITFNLNLPFSNLIIDQPTVFSGTVADTNAVFSQPTGQPIPNPDREYIQLQNLAATGYVVSVGKVDFYQGDNLVYTLKIQTPQLVLVTQTSEGLDVWTGGAYDTTKAGTLISPITPPGQSPPVQTPPPPPSPTPPHEQAPPPPPVTNVTNNNTVLSMGGGGGGGGGGTVTSANNQLAIVPPANGGANPSAPTSAESSEISLSQQFGTTVGAADMAFVAGTHIGADFQALGGAYGTGQDPSPFQNQMFSDLKDLLNSWSAGQPGLSTGVSTPGGPPVTLPGDFVVNLINDGFGAITGGKATAQIDVAFGGAVQQFFGIERSFLIAHTPG